MPAVRLWPRFSRPLRLGTLLPLDLRPLDLRALLNRTFDPRLLVARLLVARLFVAWRFAALMLFLPLALFDLSLGGLTDRFLRMLRPFTNLRLLSYLRLALLRFTLLRDAALLCLTPLPVTIFTHALGDCAPIENRRTRRRRIGFIA